MSGPPEGGGGKASRAQRRGGSNVRSWEVLPVVVSSPVGGSVRCSVQGGQLSKLQGGSCPVERPVAGARAARVALPAARDWSTAPGPRLPNPLPSGTPLPTSFSPPFFRGQGPIFVTASSAQSLCLAPGAATNQTTETAAGCIMCLWLGDSREGQGTREGGGGAMLATPPSPRSNAEC